VDIGLNVNRTLDVGACLHILMDTEIFDSISEDSATFDDLRVDVMKDIWLTIETDNDLIVVVQLKRIFSKCFDCHIHILPLYRKEHSKEAGNEILKWCEDNVKGSTLTAMVPFYCENVGRFLLSFGFNNDGVLPKAWLKNDKLNDMFIFSRGI